MVSTICLHTLPFRNHAEYAHPPYFVEKALDDVFRIELFWNGGHVRRTTGGYLHLRSKRVTEEDLTSASFVQYPVNRDAENLAGVLGKF
jgi:hypothetical protein